MLHFFYLVRLAQQGFLYLISGAYPDLEPEAVIYVCDKMVGASVYAERSHHKSDKENFRRVAFRLMKDLVDEKDKPVAEGFKTTFKQIMDIIQSLIFQATTKEKSNTTTIPPIWVVLPNISMLDNNTFAVPGAVPTLPFPESMLPALTSAHNTFPSAADELKKQADLLEERRKAFKVEAAAKRLARKENDAKVLAEKELAAKELATKQINGNVVEEHLEEEEDEDSEEDDDDEDDDEDNEEFSDHYYEDRFADADTSDDDELSTQTPAKAVELTKSISQASQLSNSQASQVSQVSDSQVSQVSNSQVSQASNSQVSQASNHQAIQPPVIQDKPVSDGQARHISSLKSGQAPATPEVPKANSSWLNFAAASPAVDNHSGPTSPRDNNRGNKPYHVNPRY